jgi:hypothetical protein
MVDRDTIARLPSPAYTCKQASSYDRHSTEPGSPTWWANMDRSYFVRVEQNDGRTEHVLMDAAGPGAVVCSGRPGTAPAAASSATVRCASISTATPSRPSPDRWPI